MTLVKIVTSHLLSLTSYSKQPMWVAALPSC